MDDSPKIERQNDLAEKRNVGSPQKPGFLARIAGNPLEEAVVCICLALLTVILFVLLGGVRMIYSVIHEKHPETRNYSNSEIEVIPVPERVHEMNYGQLNQISDGRDLRDEVFTHVLYAEVSSEKMRMQGACTDGTWIWAGWSIPMRIMKINTLTHEKLEKTYDEATWPYGHINDMTYNPNTGKLYVIAYDGEKPETWGDVAVVNAETLEYEGVIHLLDKHGNLLPVGGITYDRIHDQFIASRRGGVGVSYYVLDAKFNYVKRILIERYESYTLQGIETDGKYLYRGLYYGEEGSSFLFVYNLEGEFVKLLAMPKLDTKNEVEDIMYDWRGNWFINGTVVEDDTRPESGYVIYYAGLYSEVDYSQIDRLLTVLEKQMAAGQKVSDLRPADILY